MGKLIASFIVGLAAGFAFAILQPSKMVVVSEPTGPADAVASVECVCDVQGSQDYDSALQFERDTNNLLIAEIDALQSELERMDADLVEKEFRSSDNWMQSALQDLLANEQPVDRRQQLIDGGFDPSRADWIAQRERELQIEAAGNGAGEAGEFEPMTTLDTRVKARAALREEIGDYEYERYLAASGQSTKVSVTQVLTDSPAQHAGLQVGDRILDYDGERVFNMIELAERAQSGEQGRTVIVSIERDGAPMQIAVPEGPLGISGGKPLNY